MCVGLAPFSSGMLLCSCAWHKRPADLSKYSWGHIHELHTDRCLTCGPAGQMLSLLNQAAAFIRTCP